MYHQAYFKRTTRTTSFTTLIIAYTLAKHLYNTPPPKLLQQFKYQHYLIKRKLEDVCILPFVALGKLLALVKPLQKQYKVFFFFPFYHTGGAEKVHALITQAASGTDAIIFFTRKSADDTFKKTFEQSGCTIKDISAYTDNKLMYFFNLIYRGIIAGYINQQPTYSVVFNGQCNFAYKLSPWLIPSIKQIELIHSFNSFSWIRLPFLPFIHQTVMISQVRIENHLEQYEQLNVPKLFNQKIIYICNAITLPEKVMPKNWDSPLQVLYVGRGTPEKRVHLVAAIAQQVQAANHSIQFTIAGDVAEAIPADLKKYCTLLGNIDDDIVLAQLYQQAHVLLITSVTEGFPMVIMEAMANGCVVIGTPVGDIPIHLQKSEAGFITTTAQDEQLICAEITQHILALQKNTPLASTMGQRGIHYAKEYFDLEQFKQRYKQLLRTV
jgi:glycosyltransferase involved in cell wall biosynthesis